MCPCGSWALYIPEMSGPPRASTAASLPAALWQVEVRCPRSQAEAVAEAVAEVWQVVPVLEYRPGRGTARVRAFLEPVPTRSRWQEQCARLRQHLKTLDMAGHPRARWLIHGRPLLRENWAESWKRHFRPLHIGPLVVRASWQQPRLQPDQIEIVLDPGLSFGTGHHPTTRYCLEELVRRRKTGCAQSLLDAGTGSGILAVAAARLGYCPVEAFDVDAAAVKTARANARGNGVLNRIRFQQLDLLRLPQRGPCYAVICANVTAPLLLAARERLGARLAPGGWLVMAGILDREFPAVCSAYAAQGLVCVRTRREGRWRSGTFQRPAG
jgi:ribosomal protein L11 methyltransferase